MGCFFVHVVLLFFLSVFEDRRDGDTFSIVFLLTYRWYGVVVRLWSGALAGEVSLYVRLAVSAVFRQPHDDALSPGAKARHDPRGFESHGGASPYYPRAHLAPQPNTVHVSP